MWLATSTIVWAPWWTSGVSADVRFAIAAPIVLIAVTY